MNLTQTLRNQGFDLIDGPVRNQKLLQIWLKHPLDEAQIYYQHLEHAFQSSVSLEMQEVAAMDVVSQHTNEFAFHIGLSVLDGILQSIGCANLELDTKLAKGKKVRMQYRNAVTQIVPAGQLSDYFSAADFKYANPVLLRNANRNRLIILSGILLAKELYVEIEQEQMISPEVLLALNQSTDGKMRLQQASESLLQLQTTGNQPFPVAIQANRIDFDKGTFQGMNLVTDNRNWF